MAQRMHMQCSRDTLCIICDVMYVHDLTEKSCALCGNVNVVLYRTTNSLMEEAHCSVHVCLNLCVCECTCIYCVCVHVRVSCMSTSLCAPACVATSSRVLQVNGRSLCARHCPFHSFIYTCIGNHSNKSWPSLASSSRGCNHSSSHCLAPVGATAIVPAALHLGVAVESRPPYTSSRTCKTINVRHLSIVQGYANTRIHAPTL